MGREKQAERELLSFNNSWWSSVIRTGSITLCLKDASSWSVLQESNRSGWLINTHLGGWRGETTTEQWTIKCTLIPFVRLSSCFCAALTYFSVCLSLCLFLGESFLSCYLCFWFCQQSSFNKELQKEVPSEHLFFSASSLCLAVPPPFLSFFSQV